MNQKKKAYLLALDTSTSSMTAAVLQGGTLLNQLTSRVERNHSLYLVPAVQSIMRELGMKTRDIDAFVVGLGPGSYTGVRIAITVAKTMAWALGKPVVGVSSLEALALGAVQDKAENEPLWVVPLMDARRGNSYTGLFGCDGGSSAAELPRGWRRLGPDANRRMDAWAEELLQHAKEAAPEERPRRIVFAGEVEPFRATLERLATAWPDVAVETLPHELAAHDIGRLGWRRYAAGDTDDMHGLVPNYTQLAEAEAKLLAKQRN